MKVYFGGDNISELIQSSMDKIKTIVDNSTIIGDKIVTDDGTSIIPISKVTVGFVVGGGEYSDMAKSKVGRFPMTGGSSGGISVSPVGFLVTKQGEVNFINVENKTAYQTLLNIFNSILSKFQEVKKDDKESENAEK